jgi:class 3 adenylate cyclase
MAYNGRAMEPRIRYAQTEDGVSIAFWMLGEGMPVVHMASIAASHIQLEWQIPECRRWYERLAQKRKLVRYDMRGYGLSDRDVTDFSLDAHVLDLEAVVDRLNLERFALLGVLHAGPTAIAYAARHPERVSHLVLWCSYARGSDYSGASQAEVTRGLIHQNWEIYTETVAHTLLGWSAGEPARRFAALMRECATQDVARAALAATREFDVTPVLPHVKSATLVLHRRELPWHRVALARDLASRIPDARLLLLEGSSIAPFLGDSESVLAAIDEFLGGAEEAAEPKAAEAGVFRTVLFTDVEGSTALTQRLGDAKARDLLRQHERIVREALKAHGGSELKTMGDGFMASFSSATRSLECAIAMQRAFAAWNEAQAARPATGSGPAEEILVRIGLNAGEPVAEEGDLFGTAVIEAARIAAAAEGGEILVSNVVRELAKGKEFVFADRGDAPLKGFEEPVRLFEVRWQE